MLKLQRNQSQDIVGGIFAIIDIIIFILILCGIGLKTIYPMFVYYSLITFVVSMFFTFLFSSGNINKNQYGYASSDLSEKIKERKTGETNFVHSTGFFSSLYIIYSEVQSYSRNFSNLL